MHVYAPPQYPNDLFMFQPDLGSGVIVDGSPRYLFFFFFLLFFFSPFLLLSLPLFLSFFIFISLFFHFSIFHYSLQQVKHKN
jgi:hypothetical protein